MTELLSFFIVIAAGLLLSEIFNRLHLPWVVSLIVAGIIIGPFGFSILEPTQTLDFLAEVGLVFLMFMAGLETRLSTLKEYKQGIAALTLLNGLIPFLIGVQIGLFFDYSMNAALLLGAVFVSSSIAIVIPALSKHKLLETKLGKTILTATMIEDIASLIILSVLLQTSLTITSIPLPIFYLIILVMLFILRRLIPQLQHKILPKFFLLFRTYKKKDLFQQELRLVISVLIGTVVIFEILGLHPIIAGFFAGLILSESIKSEKLNDKLRVISYGIFVPIFFVVIGMETNLGILVNAQYAIILVIAVVLGSMLSKFFSGFFAGLMSKFSSGQSMLIGAATIPQLTTTLAVAFAASHFGLFDDKLITAMIILSLISTVISPILMNLLIKKFKII